MNHNIETAIKVSELLMAALDSWPDAGELNPQFAAVATVLDVLQRWIAAHNPQSLVPVLPPLPPPTI